MYVVFDKKILITCCRLEASKGKSATQPKMSYEKYKAVSHITFALEAYQLAGLCH